MRPEIGQATLLVYRECPCGNWCATGEGAIAPLCPSCGAMMLPLGGLAPELPEEDKERLGRAHRGLGFAALFTNEIEAVKLLGRVRSFLGISQARQAHDPFGDSSRDAGPYALHGEVDGRHWDKVRTHDDLMATAMRFYRYGAKRKSFSVTEDTIIRTHDLVLGEGARPDSIETPIQFVTPFGDVRFTLAAWRSDGDAKAYRCTCPRDPDGPADQEHEVDPGCPRHKRRHG